MNNQIRKAVTELCKNDEKVIQWLNTIYHPENNLTYSPDGKYVQKSPAYLKAVEGLSNLLTGCVFPPSEPMKRMMSTGGFVTPWACPECKTKYRTPKARPETFVCEKCGTPIDVEDWWERATQ